VLLHQHVQVLSFKIMKTGANNLRNASANYKASKKVTEIKIIKRHGRYSKETLKETELSG